MKEKESRTIYCPVCHRGRILDAASQTDPAHLQLFGPRQSAKAEWFTNTGSSAGRGRYSGCEGRLLVAPGDAL